MKSSRVYVKANYIKKAKTDWIYCDAQIFRQNNISMLKLSSINPSNDEKDDTLSRISNFSNVSTIYRSKLSQTIGLKVLCNLSEFKSSEIKPVNFYNTEKFAIRLMPSGILSSKKLFFIPEHEEDLTKWCTILGEHISKPKDMELKTQKVIDTKDTTESIIVKPKDEHDKDAYATIKRRKELENEIIEAENMVSTLKRNQAVAENNKYNDDKCSITPNSPKSYDSYKSEEIYFAMDDNDVYEASNDNVYTVCVEESSDSKNKGIRGSYLMKLKPEGIELCDIKKGEAVHDFPYIFIRRFGAKQDLLRLEAGRKCSTGEGSFIFRFKDAGKAVATIKQLVKELKGFKASEHDQEDSASNRHSATGMSRNSGGSFECTIDTNAGKHSSKASTSSDNNASSPNSPGSGSYSPNWSPGTPPSVAINNIAVVEQARRQYTTVAAQKPLHPLYNSVNSIPNGRAASAAQSPPPPSPGVSTAAATTTTTTGNQASNIQIAQSPSRNRLPVINNAFNRNQYASSFTYRRQAPTNIPVIKDDISARSAVYDNIPLQKQNANQLSCQSLISTRTRTMQNPQTNLQFTSSYTMKGSLANTDNGQYDNVPNNQRCIKELETMLMDLGIPTN